MSQLLSMRWPLLLLVFLAGCATRGPHTDVDGPQPDSLEEEAAQTVFLAWRNRLGQYLDREGKADPAALLQTREHHSLHGLRPARITFGVLAAEGVVSGSDALDVNGLLLGKRTIGAHDWYLFLVGIVQRSQYRPTGILDLRLVGFSVAQGKLRWQVGAPSPQAVQRYRITFSDSPPIRFPGDAERFETEVTGNRVSVHELQSGADWSLRLGNTL